MLEKLMKKIEGKNKRIVFPEGCDPRILNAASRLHKEGIVTPILLGNPSEIKAAADKYKENIEGIELVDHLNFEKRDAMIQKMVELRRGKMDAQACNEALEKTNYFGTMYVKMGYADGLLGGATYSTADTVRPALQLIKTKPNNNIVSSCFIMVRGEERLVMGDCSINIDPSEDDLVEIALETARTARFFEVEPVMAMLSYSTLGSGKGASVDKVKNASLRIKNIKPDFDFDGEFQFDAAYDKGVSQVKAPLSPIGGRANTFIFPNIDAANIGYKIAQRLGGFEAVGPVLQGLNAPINDLSRGCSAEEVYKMAIITALATDM
ncbi:MAG: phosphate acetyltransferase [Erysipelotrichaceae bacterium]